MKNLNYLNLSFIVSPEEYTYVAEPTEEKANEGNTQPDGQVNTKAYGDSERVFVVKVRPECALSGTTTGSGNVKYDHFARVTAYPADYRKFEGWYEKGVKISPYQYSEFGVRNDRDIIAKFTTTSGFYMIGTSVSVHVEFVNGFGKIVPGGTVTPGNFSVQEGGTINFLATPTVGYKFSFWEDVDSGKAISNDNPCPIKITRDMQLKANFIPGGFERPTNE